MERKYEKPYATTTIGKEAIKETIGPTMLGFLVVQFTGYNELLPVSKATKDEKTNEETSMLNDHTYSIAGRIYKQ